MGTLTTNYSLIKPAETDSMANFTDINSSWDTLAAINSSRIVASLPTSGTYKVGDRVYLTPDKSIYVCICNDPIWGIFWRPVHKGMSPWRTLGSGISTSASTWDVTDSVSDRPIQVALDNCGNMYWRGVLRYIGAPALTKGVSQNPFIALPAGIQPRQDMSFLLGHDNLTVGTTGLTQWEGAMLQISHTVASPMSLVALGGNGTGDERTFYFDGKIEWSIGTGVFQAP